MFNEEELFFQCPYCFQRISFLVEELYGNQSYIEDCEVCCQPIEVSLIFEEESIQINEVKRAQ